MTTAEVMAYLRCGSKWALYSLIKEWHLPYCKRGRLYLFDWRDIDAWVHGHPNAVEYVRARRKTEAARP